MHILALWAFTWKRFDEESDILARRDYIWNHLRRQWIEFYAWRWEGFWRKICGRLHAVGKKVMINNAWCSDPFEALYRYGIDYRKLFEAGVDYLVAETVATGLELLNRGFVRVHQFMTMAQLMSVYNPDCKLLTLLGVKDCTEEWDVLHHAPTRLERDMFSLATLYTFRKGTYETSANGYMVTLGDGITADEWSWIRERSDLAFSELPVKVLAPTVIWSDHAHTAFLEEYLATRRASVHKQMYELKKRNAALGAVARVEDITCLDGPLFVPNFDLCSLKEQEEILAYNKAPVICTVPAGFLAGDDKIKYDICFEDSAAAYKLCAFAYNLRDNNALENELKSVTISKPVTLSTPVTMAEPAGDPTFWTDAPFFKVPMPFRAISDSFLQSCTRLINYAHGELFRSDAQILPVLLRNGTYRIYVFNQDNLYSRFEIFARKGIAKVENVSKYPVMPAKFVLSTPTGSTKYDGAKAESMRIGEVCNEIPYGFVAKVAPCGVSVFDVTLID